MQTAFQGRYKKRERERGWRERSENKKYGEESPFEVCTQNIAFKCLSGVTQYAHLCETNPRTRQDNFFFFLSNESGRASLKSCVLNVKMRISP